MNFIEKLSNLFGTTIKPAELKKSDKETSAAVQRLQREFAEHPVNGLTPKRLVQLLTDAEQGDLKAQAELFYDMEERDMQIRAEFGKYIDIITELEWHLTPPGDATATEKKACKKLEAQIRDTLNVEEMLEHLAKARGFGYAACQLEWQMNGGQWFPTVHSRPFDWFQGNWQDKTELRLRDYSGNGAELVPFGWVVHVANSSSMAIARGGLFRGLAWPYIFKHYSVRDFAELLEIYNIPIRIGIHPANASKTEKSELMKAVMGIGHNAGGIISEDMRIEFQNVMSSGNTDAYKTMIDLCDGWISKAILGGTLNSQTGTNGNRSLGEVHSDGLTKIRNSNARKLATTLDGQLIYPIAMLNGLFADNRAPRWTFDIEEADDLALYADAIPKLVQTGMNSIPVDWVHKKLKIPKAEGQEPVLTAGTPQPAQPTPAPLPPNAKEAALTAMLSEPVRFTPDQQLIEDLADDVLSHAVQPIDTAAILSAIQAAKDPDDLAERLAVLVEETDSAQFRQLLERSMFAAELMGYVNN